MLSLGTFDGLDMWEFGHLEVWTIVMKFKTILKVLTQGSTTTYWDNNKSNELDSKTSNAGDNEQSNDWERKSPMSGWYQTTNCAQGPLGPGPSENNEWDNNKPNEWDSET